MHVCVHVRVCACVVVYVHMCVCYSRGASWLEQRPTLSLAASGRNVNWAGAAGATIGSSPGPPARPGNAEFNRKWP